jgi:hypothetical protein
MQIKIKRLHKCEPHDRIKEHGRLETQRVVVKDARQSCMEKTAGLTEPFSSGDNSIIKQRFQRLSTRQLQKFLPGLSWVVG